jgi:photosystem II stability/assembly factor-like uncharacterized protein
MPAVANGVILKTTNGGSNWSESGVVLGQYMYDISFSIQI